MKEKSFNDDHRRRDIQRPPLSWVTTIIVVVWADYIKDWFNFPIRCFLRIHFNSLSYSRIHFQFTIYFANLDSIHDFFRETTSNSLSFYRIHFQFTIYFANSLSFHFQFTIFFEISLLFFREFTFKSLSFSRIDFQFTIFFMDSLSIHDLFREFIFISLSFSWIHYQFTTSFLN